jgi:hypothetical protein
MTIKSLYPASRPALGLDFAKTKRLDPRVTFTRASTGTFVGADGLIKTAASGVSRFDHNPTTGESLGLLVEGARINYASQSFVALNATLISSNDTTYQPLQGGSVYKFSIGSSGLQFYVPIFNAPGYTSIGDVDTLTFYLRSDSPVTITSDYNGVPSLSGIYFSNGTTANYSHIVTQSASVLGFTRYTIIYTVASGNGNNISRAQVNVSGTAGTNFYVFGAQWESRMSFPTSYIPTSGSQATRAADVATLSNTNSSIFPTSAFTTVNTPFGTAGGGSTVKLVGPTIKRTAIYAGDLPQVQINALTGTGDFWRWRVVGQDFALPNFTTNGSVTVDWGDGTVQTLTTGVYTFTNGGGYHDIGFRLNSGTFFKPNINANGTYAPRVIAVGPAPASMKVDGYQNFQGCSALRSMDGYADYSATTNLFYGWRDCSSLTNFPLINTTGVTQGYQAWLGCSSLTSFPLINTSSWGDMRSLWTNCSSLTSFPLLNTSAAYTLDSAWANCSSLTSFPLINTASVTSMGGTWSGCSALASFPLINTSACTFLGTAWQNCSSLTSFPAINTSSCANFANTWWGCQSLSSFPSINTAAGTTFNGAWYNCDGLTSFPALNFSSATTFNLCWYDCNNLSSFPANVFNTTGTLVGGAFQNAFGNCALTAASIENILTSLVTNGQSNIALNLNGGTNAGAATWTANAVTAYNTLISRGWTIARNA